MYNEKKLKVSGLVWIRALKIALVGSFAGEGTKDHNLSAVDLAFFNRFFRISDRRHSALLVV